MEQLKDKVVVPVIDHKGNRLRVNVVTEGGKIIPNGASLSRAIWNCPWRAFFPDLPFVIVDWTSAVEEMKKKSTETGTPYEELMANLVMEPIEYDGKLWYAGWYWGSAVKNFQTIGVTEDILLEIGFVSFTEDGQRASRAYFCNGMYGGLQSDTMRVLVVPDKYVWHDKYRVGDGCSYFAIEDFKKGKRLGMAATEFSDPEQTMYVWQRFNWSKISATATRLIKAKFANLKLEWLPMFIDGVISDFKRSLILADGMMAKHPYMTGSIPDSIGDMLYRLGTTVPLRTMTRVALPTLMEHTYVFSKKDKVDGLWMIYCCPTDSWKSIFVGETEYSELYDQESARFAEQQAVQHTTTSENGVHIKGVYALIPKEELDGYDAIICAEDIKTFPGEGVGALRKRAKTEPFELVLPRTVVSFTAWYGPGQCFGAPAKEWKATGKDYDGDFGFVSKIKPEDRAIWDDAASFVVHEASNFKLTKTFTPLSDFSRAQMIVQSLQNVIGFATKVQAMPFAKQESERDVFVETLNRESIDDMDQKLSNYVKVGTDLYKVFIPNIITMLDSLRRLQKLLLDVTGRQLAYLNWPKSSLAFKKVIPDFESVMDKKWLAFLKEQDRQVRKSGKKVESMYRVHIQPEAEHSTISEIYRVARPLILEQFKGQVDGSGRLKEGACPDFLKVIESLPLSAFINWAPSVDPDSLTKAKKLYREYCIEMSAVDKSSQENWAAWKESWQTRAMKWASDSFVSIDLAVYACWRVTHESGNENSSGSFVFVSFPEGAYQIVMDKPGRFAGGTQDKIMLTGLQYNFSIPSRDLIDVEPFIGEVKHVMDRGKLRVVLCSVEPLPKQNHTHKIENLVGFCDAIDARAAEFFGFIVPAPGTYNVIVKKWSRDHEKNLRSDDVNTWQAGLTKI